MPSSRRDRDILHNLETRLREEDPNFVVLFDLVGPTGYGLGPVRSAEPGEDQVAPSGPIPGWGWFDVLIWKPTFLVAASVSFLASVVLCVLLDRAALADNLLAQVVLIASFPAVLVPLARYLRFVDTASPPPARQV